MLEFGAISGGAYTHDYWKAYEAEQRNKQLE